MIPSDMMKNLPGPDTAAVDAVAAREAQLTKPPGSLGRLESLTQWLAAWQGQKKPDAGPRLNDVRALVFAGNHGVTAQGVSAYPSDVTVQMVANFEAGGAAINQLCKAFDVGLAVIPLALDQPTGDISQGPALSNAEFEAAWQSGHDAVADDTDLLCIGEMGIGNTTVAAALCLGLFGGEAQDWTGPGTGLNADGVNAKAQVVRQAVQANRGAVSSSSEYGLAVLKCLGGRELAAMAGAIMSARHQRIPVLLDGYVCGAAAACLAASQPGALDHCRAAHVSAEPGHGRLLERLGMTPLLSLDMRLGEASGAVLAVALARAALACFNGMATFDDAGVSREA